MSESTILPAINGSEKAMPLIPPKVGANKALLAVTATPEAEPDEKWMYVMSPREVHGARGPHSVEEMRFLYKMGDIGEGTLVWTEGQVKWEKIEKLPKLRYKLLTLPEIPSKKASELEVSTTNPILPLPAEATALACSELKNVDKFTISQSCSRCGAVAFGHAEGHAEQLPDLLRFGGGKEIGFNIKFVAEIVPGFLWIGNQAASRVNNLQAMGITMSVGCTFDIKNPPDDPPKFRGHVAPLAEFPIPADDPRTSQLLAEPLADGAPTTSCSIEAIFDTFEKAYDFIELERLYHEKAAMSDPLAPKKLKGGPTDEYGRPVKSKFELMDALAHKREYLFIKQRPSRVMLWCKNGTDRSCAIAMAYLIRKFGVSLQYATNLINAKRKGVSVNPLYVNALKLWAQKHSLGELLCDDCIAGGLQPESTYNVPMFEGIVESMSNHLKSIDCPAVLIEVKKYMFVNQLLKHPSRSLASKEIYFKHAIIDLCIGGSNIQDQGLKKLTDALSITDAVRFLERIDLKNNGLTGVGIGYLVDFLLMPSSSSRSALNSALVHLDLSHNRIGETGGSHLARLLVSCAAIMTLDVTNNALGDSGGCVLIDALQQPNEDIFEEDDDVKQDASAETSPLKANFFVAKSNNKSLTDLKIGGNRLGKASIESISFVVKSSPWFSGVSLDYGRFSSTELKFFMFNLRSFGQALRRLSLNDIRLSVDTVKDLFNVFEGNCPISHISLVRCGITKAHLAIAAPQLAKSKFLRYLCLSNNHIEDEGLEYICNAIRHASESPLLSGFTSSVLRLNADEVERELSRLKKLNIVTIDVSCCGITGSGAASLVEALGRNKFLRDLDLSDNNIGTECMNQLGALILRCRNLVSLRMNRCNILTKGANTLLRLLGDDILGVNNASSDNPGLRTLELSGNMIKDSFSESLRRYLEINNVIQFLDIGFNELTDEGLRDVKVVLNVVASSVPLKKYNELHINLIGNPCDPYFLEPPNHSRAKSTMRYSSQFNRSVTHVPESSKADYVSRMNTFNSLELQGYFPPKSYVA